jgi:hypothetical protein
MKILQLGGAFHQSFFVEELAANNYFVECLDNLPNNPGHSYAEKSSITDIKKIKEILTQDNYIISSYGSDLAELSRNKLVEDNGSHINLLMKYSARLFLQKVLGKKNQPNIKIAELNTTLSNKSYVVKPNISSGSKNVSIVKSGLNVKEAIKSAQSISLDGLAVIEDYIENDGNKYYCEGIIVNNEIKIVFGCSKSSKNNLIWDGSIQIRKQNICLYNSISYEFIENFLKDCVSKIALEINKSSFAFNIDFFIRDKEIFIIEFAPRPGGNLLPAVLEHTFGINYSLTYFSILKGEPKIFYREKPIFNIDIKKSLNISIMEEDRYNNLDPNKRTNIITLKRNYRSNSSSEKLLAIVYGT